MHVLHKIGLKHERQTSRELEAIVNSSTGSLKASLPFHQLSETCVLFWTDKNQDFSKRTSGILIPSSGLL